MFLRMNSMWDIIVVALVLLICLTFSIIFLQGKGGFLIAGFNMLPKEQKEKIDWVNLCKFMGKVMLSVSCSVAFILIYLVTNIKIFNTLGLMIFAVSVVTALGWFTIRYKAPLRK